jgi:hypothetical protein
MRLGSIDVGMAKVLSAIGEADLPSLSQQQIQAELLLELLHVPAERRLRYAEHIRRAREAAELGDRGEIAKLPDVYHSGWWRQADASIAMWHGSYTPIIFEY